jgi:hypothetical protein
MSAIVKTITPFIEKEMLLQALDCVGCRYTLNHDQIITERKDYYGQQKFVWYKGRYSFQHDSSAELSEFNRRWGSYPEGWKNNWKAYQSVNSFLQAVEKEYNRIYSEKLAELERIRLEKIAEQERIRLEQEMKRIEQERLAYIEQQKQSIIQKAKEQGYSVQEKKVKNKVKLILRRNTY